MEIADIVSLLEEAIKSKTEQFHKIEEEHATNKATFMNDLRKIEQLVKKNTPIGSDIKELMNNPKAKTP